MPVLQNARHECFARSRADGARLECAYDNAGYASGNGHAYKLARRPEVAERIAELRAEQAALADASAAGLIAALLRVARASEGDASPAGLRERRSTLLEVRRLVSQLPFHRAREDEEVERRIRSY